jgi:dienelactone hydrolase
VNEYELIRATMINEEFGWIGFVADLYGEDMHDVQEFDVKVAQATKYRSDTELFNGRVQAAIDTLKENPNVDTSRIAIIGYCLGKLIYVLFLSGSN